MPIALADLVFYALIFFTIALAFTTRKITQAILGGLIQFVNHLPWIGSAIAGLLRTAEQAISNACGQIEDGCDHLIGASWHLMARYADELWKEIEGTPAALLHIARVVGGGVYRVSGLKGIVHTLTLVAHTALRLARATERELGHLLHRVHVIEQDISKGIGEDVLPRLKHLEREIGRIETKKIPAILDAETQAAKAIENLYEWAKGKASLLGVGTFAFAVTAVLESILGSFIRCAAWKGLFNRLTCGMGQLLLDLLEGAIAIMVVEDICAITHLAIEVAESDPVQGFLTDVTQNLDNLITCQGVSVAPALQGPYFAPPPVQPYAALA
jgi:hypothetical protein